MIKKARFFIIFLLCCQALISQSLTEDQYSGFSSRSFLKFDSFFTIPTFSLMNYDGQYVGLLSRVSNTQFEDAPQLHVLSYAARFSDKAGFGAALFQQTAGVFKDFGAVANYAYQLRMGYESNLTFGFNFFYSRRGVNQAVVLSSETELLLSNYQSKSVVVFQPAVTYQYKDFYGGIFLENLVDFNLKDSEMVSDFADKTISAHLGYGYTFENANGLFSDTRLNAMGVVRRAKEDGISYGGNLLIDVPRAGWIKGGYDKLFGFNAGLGINISERLAIGYAYENHETLGVTNEFGVIYKFGNYERTRSRRKKKIEVVLHPDRGNKKELKKAKDSIRKLNTRIREMVKDNPNLAPVIIRDTIVVRDTIRIETEKMAVTDEKDTTLKRRNAAPWRSPYTVVSSDSGGGVMYYVAVDQYRDFDKVKELLKKYKRKQVKVRYIRDPKTNFYYIYIQRFINREDADELESEINGGKKGFEKNTENDLGLKVKSVSKDPVYVVKIDSGSGTGETYKKPKKNAPARVQEMTIPNTEPGYYIRVFVNGQQSYADRNVDELKADGFDAGYFIDPKTGYRHVYIYKTNDRNEAIKQYNNNLNGTYYDTKAIIYIR